MWYCHLYIYGDSCGCAGTSDHLSGNIAATAIGACTAVVNYTVTATDNCPGVTVTRIAGPASGSAFPIGVTTVTHRATDAAGNTSTCSFNVTVTDGQLPVITAQPVTRTVCSGTNVVYSVTATNALSYQWQAWNGSTWNNITGATSSTYTVNSVNSGMNTNTFRVIVNGLCNTATSNAASLYVNGLPIVTLSASGTTQLLPGRSLTLNTQVNPSGGSYVWYLNGSVLSGSNGSSLTGITVDQTGTYKVAYTDQNGCSTTSADLTISGMPSVNIYVAPNPSNGQFTVRVYNGVNEELTMRIYDAKGALVYNRKVATSVPYSSIQVDLQAMGIPPSGIYHLVLFNKEGKRIGTQQLVVYR